MTNMDWRQALLRWRVQWKHGTTVAWESANTLLLLGEPGWDQDLLRMKIGDGETPWNDLPWASLDPIDLAEIEILLASVTDLDDGRMTVIDADVGSDYRVQQDLRLGNAFVGRVGLFDDFASATPEVPPSIVFVRTDGYALGGVGAANYTYDAAVDAAYVTANPRSSFLADDGRGFKLIPSRVSTYMLGAVGGGIVDDGPALQAFLDFTTAYDVGIGDVGGSFLSTLALTMGDALTKQYVGKCVITFSGTPATVADGVGLTVDGWDGAMWDSIKLVGPSGSVSNYAAKTWHTGLHLTNGAGRNMFGKIEGSNFAFATLACSIGNTSVSHFGFVKATDCGSGVVGGATHYGLTTSWASPVNSGASGSVAQTAVIDVATLPPEFITSGYHGAVGDIPLFIRLPDPTNATGYRLHWISAVTPGVGSLAGQLTVFPWVNPALAPGTNADYVYGGGVYFHGGDSNCHTVDNIDAMRCGVAISCASLYGPNISSLTTQACGTVAIFGKSGGGAIIGFNIKNPYFEGETEGIIWLGRGGGDNDYGTIDGEFAADLSKWYMAGAPKVSVTFADHPTFQTMQGTRWSYKGRNKSFVKIPFNGQYSSATQSVVLNRGDQHEVLYRDSANISIAVPDLNVHRLTGEDAVLVTVIGTGLGSAPTGAITFPVPAGYTVNGHTASDGVTNGTTAFTGSGFTVADVGRPITIIAGGVAGADLKTTIAAFTDTTHVTLTAATTSSASGQTYHLGVISSNLGGPGHFMCRFDNVAMNLAITRISRTAITPLTFSRSGVLAVGAGTFRLYAERPMTILSVRANVGVAPSATDLIVDVNKNGVTLFTTQSARPKVLTGANTSGVAMPAITTLAAGDYLTVDIDQAGGVAADLTVQIWAV